MIYAVPRQAGLTVVSRFGQDHVGSCEAFWPVRDLTQRVQPSFELNGRPWPSPRRRVRVSFERASRAVSNACQVAMGSEREEGSTRFLRSHSASPSVSTSARCSASFS
jgi:hypothetical protein